MAMLAAVLIATPLQAAPWSLARSEVQQVASPDGHPYRLLVSWPEGEPPAQGWPVLWLLDGEDNFAIATMTARRLARAGARSGVDPGLIVAIDSGPLARRVSDYTPPAPGYAIPKGFPASGLATGGADAFLDFIDRRLRPIVSKRWRVDVERQAIAGHSFGGLLGLYAMYRGRNFSAVAAVSPSLWYGGDVLRKAESATPSGKHVSLLLAGSPSEGGPNGASGASGEALVTRWEQRGNSASYLLLPGQDHGSTMLAAMSAAIVTAFGRSDDGRSNR